MNDQECFFQNLQRLADGVVAMFGRNCEACVHDLTTLQSSLIYIRGDVTHRQPGAPATDLLLKLIAQDTGTTDHYTYKTTSSDGRTLKSTTILIRNASKKPVAAMCINFDTTEFYNVGQALLPFFSITEPGHQAHIETFAHSVGETIEALFHNLVGEIGRHPATMNLDEKNKLIALLEDNGIFQFKGAVEQVAKMMGVTRFTVYNYLKKVRANHINKDNEE